MKRRKGLDFCITRKIFDFWLMDLLLACVLVMTPGCDKDPDFDGGNTVIIPEHEGLVEFRFLLPSYKIPKDKIHRISLGFAYSADSLYKGQFFKKINVSDYQEIYTLLFIPDDYYYDATITCSCAGDTCLNGGFPGGRFGVKHNFNKFYVLEQQTTIIETHFQ